MSTQSDNNIQTDPRAENLNRFLDDLADRIRKGYHFVPFLGAGFSQEAGFPTTAQLRDHLLPYWILRALELNPFATSLDELYEPALTSWNPTDAWWPSPGDEVIGINGQGRESPLYNLRQAQWVILTALYDQWQRQKGRKAVMQISTLHISPDTLKQAAELLCGAAWVAERSEEWDASNNKQPPPKPKKNPARIQIADWLKLIHFLSRITRRNQFEPRIHVGPPRQSVVDSLFMHLDDQCHPGLAHMMLVALTKICRIHTVLTTNFDTMAERAYDQHHLDMEVFEVPRSAPLPNNRLVLAQRSIVKLHGGRFDVRADLSVSSPLDRADFMNAVSYVAGRDLFKNGDLGQKQSHPGKAALLFMGCGDEDERTRDFAHYVARHLPETEVFWVSLSEKDPAKISVLGLFPPLKKHVCSYPEFGSFLLLLHQRLTGSIPPAGAVYPGPWQLISPPRIPKVEPPPYEEPRLAAEEELRVLLEARLKKFYEQKALPHPFEKAAPAGCFSSKPIHLILAKGDYSAAGICVPLFHDIIFQRNEKCRMLWIDLHDITMPAGVFTRLVMILARLQGAFDPLTSLHLESLTNEGPEYKRLQHVLRQTLIRHHSNTGLSLMVFLNGQELPGAYGQYQLKAECDKKGNPNRWETRKEECRRMWEVIQAINGCAACATQFVIVAPQEYPDTASRGPSRLVPHMKRFVPDNMADPIMVTGPATGFKPPESAERAEKWLGEDSNEKNDRTDFLLVLLCLRHSSYPSEIARVMSDLSSEEFGTSRERDFFDRITSTGKKDSEGKGWLEVLNKRRVLRFRDGGFVWVNCQVADHLQQKKFWTSKPNICRRVRIRAVLGRWYGRLLFSCLDPLSAAEGIYQNVRGILDAVEADCDVSAAQLVCMADNAIMLLNSSRRLFEVRLTTTFADRSLEVTGELVETAIRALKKRSKDVQKQELQKHLECLSREVQAVRDKVALREGHFLQLVKVQSRGDFAKNPDRVIQQGAAWLHIRNYASAEEVLGDAWEKTTGLPKSIWIQGENFETPTHARNAAQEFAAKLSISDFKTGSGLKNDEIRKRFAVRLARWGLYLHLNRGQMNWVSTEATRRRDTDGLVMDNGDNLRRRQHSLKQALWFFHFGVEVLRSLTTTSDGFSYDEGIRLRAHGALAQALLEATTGPRSRRTLNSVICCSSRRMLRDAESFLGDYLCKEAGVSEAMLRLRAGEVELIEVMSLWSFDVSRSIARRLTSGDFRDLGNADEAYKQDREEFDLQLLQLAEGTEGDLRLDSGWTICAGRVIDAWLELDRAEKLLQSHPKSRWWWWILTVLKARAAEYLYTIRYVRAVSGGFNEIAEYPRIITPSVFRFVDNGLLRIVLEKDLADMFYMSRVVSSFAAIIRMDFNYSVLRAVEGAGHYRTAWQKGVIQRTGLNVATLAQLRERLGELTEENAKPPFDSNSPALGYAKSSCDVAQHLIENWKAFEKRGGK